MRLDVRRSRNQVGGRIPSGSKTVAQASTAGTGTHRYRSAVNWRVEFDMTDPLPICADELAAIELFLGDAVDRALDDSLRGSKRSVGRELRQASACARPSQESESSP